MLSKNLNLRRNIVCRLALGTSLNHAEPPDSNDDYSGIEFNQSTIIGTDETIITAMIANQYGFRISPDVFFSKYVRLEIIRGLDEMAQQYSRLNSPTAFMKSLYQSVGISLD